MEKELNKYGMYLVDGCGNIDLIVYQDYNLEEVFYKLKEKFNGLYDLKYKDFSKREIILYKLTKFNNLSDDFKQDLINKINSGEIIIS